MSEQANVGTLFVQLAAKDAGFAAGMKAAQQTVEKVADTTKAMANEVRSAFSRVSEAEKRLVAQVVGAEAAEKGRAQALGVTLAQLRAVDKAARAVADSAKAEAQAAERAAAAERERAEATSKAAAAAASEAARTAARTTTSKDSAGRGLAVDRLLAGDGLKKQIDAVGAANAQAAESAQAHADATNELMAAATAAVAAGTVLAFAKQAVDAASQFESATAGLRSVAQAFGTDSDAAVQAARDLAADGLMPLTDAAKGLKTALSVGYTLQQATTLMAALKEQAVFNRQAHYELGEAVVTTIEGVKNENSILTDATGTTKNLSIMYKEYAATLGKSVADLTTAEKRQAAYNGLLSEAQRSAGDLAIAQDTLAASTARASTAWNKASVAVGEDLSPAYRLLLDLFGSVAGAVEGLASSVPGLTAALVALASSASGLTAVIYGLRAAMASLQVLAGPVGWAILGISAAAAVAVGAYTALSTASSELEARQRSLAQMMSEKGVTGALRRLTYYSEQLRSAEADLADATDGVTFASASDVKVMRQRVEWLQRQTKVAEEAVTTEHRLAKAREQAAAQAAADTSAQKVLDELRADNLDEVQKLEAEMVDALETNFGASTEILDGIHKQYMIKIAAARAEAAKSARSELEKLKREAEQAAAALRSLLDTARAAADMREASLRGGDVGEAGETLERAFAEVEKARAESVVKARALGGEAGAALMAQAEADAVAARSELLRQAELDAEGVARVHLEGQRKEAAERRTIALDALDRAHEAELSAVLRLVEERDQVLADGTFATEEERLRIVRYYAKLIADERKKDADDAAKKAKQAADATRKAYSDAVSTVESVASTMASRHAAAISEMESDLEGLTGTAKKEQERRLEEEKQAYRRAFRVQQAAAIVSIALSTAQAVMNAMAQIPYPANIAVAALVAAMGAAQAAVVATEQPEFHTGGEVTESDRRRSPGRSTSRAVAAEVEVGEGVLTSDGLDRLERTLGSGALDALNAGMVPRRADVAAPSLRYSDAVSSPTPAPSFSSTSPMGRAGGTSPSSTGQPGETRVRVELDGREVDRVYVRNMRSGRAPGMTREIRRASGTRVGLDR